MNGVLNALEHYKSIQLIVLTVQLEHSESWAVIVKVDQEFIVGVLGLMTAIHASEGDT